MNKKVAYELVISSREALLIVELVTVGTIFGVGFCRFGGMFIDQMIRSWRRRRIYVK